MIIEIALGIALGGMLMFAGMMYMFTRTDIIIWYTKQFIKTMEKLEKELEDEDLSF